jgi:hypothetical protein
MVCTIQSTYEVREKRRDGTINDNYLYKTLSPQEKALSPRGLGSGRSQLQNSQNARGAIHCDSQPSVR